MKLFSRPARKMFCVALVGVIGLLVEASMCLAIEAGQIDDFQDGTTQGWGWSAGGSIPVDNVPHAGPDGTGDNAIYQEAFVHGSGKVVVINTVQWLGDWTAEGIAQVSMDVRNPTLSPLTMRIGIAGTDGPGFSDGDGGDTYITDGISVPADDEWHSISFSVLANDWIAYTGADDIDAALQDVTHVRIFSNVLERFIGQNGGAMYLDNILAIGVPGGVDGDYNGDEAVDASDYVIWRKLDGQSVAIGTGPDGSGPSNVPDGLVNSFDYDFWRTNYGDMSEGHVHRNSLAVPEPSSLVYLVAAISFLAGVRPFGRPGKEPAN